MLKKQLLVSVLAGFLFFGLFGTAFAANIDSEAGVDPVATSQALNAAANYNYDQASFAAVGTEAGDWEFSFDTPQTKEDIAAANHKYDSSTFDLIGTEAGIDPSRLGPLCSAC